MNSYIVREGRSYDLKLIDGDLFGAKTTKKTLHSKYGVISKTTRGKLPKLELLKNELLLSLIETIKITFDHRIDWEARR